MPVEMPRGLPFSVDTWTPSSKMKRHHFLTHAHKDHSSGIITHSSYPIYCTDLTKAFLLQQYPQLDGSMFVGIEVGRSVVIDDPDGKFTLTSFDANHCPGAVMFLFEGGFGTILHTGDCRLTPECIQCLPEKYIGKKGKDPRCRLDYVFLDCTFGKSSQKFPSKHAAVRQVINCIWKNPDAPVVYLTCDLLGQEEILVNVAQTFGSKIYVDKNTNAECFQALTLTFPEILSQDPCSRFQLFEGFPKLYERAAAKLAEARADSKPEPLILRPSAQWYVCEEENLPTESQRIVKFSEAVRDQFGVWHVCYSMHSSKEELEWALQILAPKWVVSTTPTCRAMELNYVKKHCFVSRLASDDPMWKLLDIKVEVSPDDVSVKDADCFPLDVEPTQHSAESLTQPAKISCSPKKLASLSPPSKRSPVTLFGRARLAFLDSNLPNGEKRFASTEDESLSIVTNELEQDFSFQQEDRELKHENQLEDKVQIDVISAQLEKSEEKEICKGSSGSAAESSKGFNESLRKLYRSRNVPVPQPLPSLVALMNANKRARRIF
ncbi:5' exonuclease Apollo [Tripterygium wilfordii]|uniref:5' exonuclease Apollo n=1 Tax=Tripterygium wilfordii TaxID=458696 RepID=A0A7J7DFQ1_TRIWF|nr:5' exonuclease Apollo [Tripterygium wilfordii]KAF5745133.1 5' exonuclease Apollo [Tripterygium wilfordii]